MRTDRIRTFDCFGIYSKKWNGSGYLVSVVYVKQDICMPLWFQTELTSDISIYVEPVWKNSCGAAVHTNIISWGNKKKVSCGIYILARQGAHRSMEERTV